MMPKKNDPLREPFFQKLFGNLFGGSGRKLQEGKVREYVAHRLDHGAHLSEVIQEEYVRRNCSEEEINGVIRDPGLIHDDRVSLRRLFESGELNPASARRSRLPSARTVEGDSEASLVPKGGRLAWASSRCSR
jgi:hypothetical protein